MFNAVICCLNLYCLHNLQKEKQYYEKYGAMSMFNILYWGNWISGLANTCVVVFHIME